MKMLDVTTVSSGTQDKHKNNPLKCICLLLAVMQRWCEHTVKWLYEGKDVDKDHKDMKTSESVCSVTATFLTSYLKQSFKCEVTDVSTGAVQQFTFSRQSSGEKTVTEHRISDQVTLNCSLSEHGWCRHTVKWLYEGKNVDEGNRDLKSKSSCSVSVTFLTSYLKQSFKCEVTDVSTGAVQQFTFSRQSSGEKTVWVRSIIVPAGLSALIISVVAVNIWTRPKGETTSQDEAGFTTAEAKLDSLFVFSGNKTQTEENTVSLV
ncbi:hypothetical protein GBF38_006307, partial [Nibea albiflora]